MGIDPKIEGPTRKMLGHAIRHELEDLAILMHAEGNETFLGSIRLCLFASAYIAVNSSERWPTEVDLRELARLAARSVTRLPITESEIYEYLSRCVLGSEALDEVFPPDKAVTLPLFATANLVLSFMPEGKEWWEYLDQIWDAAEAAEHISPTVFPAVLILAHRQTQQTAK